MFFILAVAVLLLAPQVSHTEIAAPGDFDPTFGIGGKVRTDFVGLKDEAFTLALQADGKLVLAGGVLASTFIEARPICGLARYNPDGSLDATFGAGGKVVNGIPSSGGPGPGSTIIEMAIQPDSKIVVTGFSGSVSEVQIEYFIVRYNPNGSRDFSFGLEGIVHQHYSSRISEGRAIAIQPDGKIVVGGYDWNATSDPRRRALARHNPNGSVDTTFGSSGIVIGSAGGFGKLIIQPGGKILAVGIGESGSVAQRFNMDGSPDLSFGSGSELIAPGFGFSSAKLQADGKIVFCGGVGTGHIALARYTADGSLDPSFGLGGVAIIDLASNEFAVDMAIQTNGKIVIAGLANTQWILLRCNSDGSVDTSFNSVTPDFGCAPSPLSTTTRVSALVIQRDGQTAAGGSTCRYHSRDFAVAGYEGDPVSVSFDLCIQDESSGDTLQVSSITGDYQFVSCRTRTTIGGTGVVTRQGSILTLQHFSSDRRVLARIDGGVNRATASIQMFSLGTTFGIMDRNTTNNICACP